ncbi:MAG: DUF1501 domain-containing protein [Planctomycetes bacterium]|nr:DUF1501 domain-containing protein [Planctomycetota bacterium]MCH9723708.1 DUF1501 domain-containing protein [Planctomycetota bacterium]MCH9776020.1 DUF1501 domain-containing protein [Planctomycetota bacterium]MCH9790194.1 DUF1501 domain-containing protein [Planctomycetota bacterium]
MHDFHSTRRDFLRQASVSGLAASALGTPFQQLLASEKQETKKHGAKKLPMPVGKAEHCIMVWLGGGSCHIDTWDPKIKGDPKAKKAGSYYDSIPTAIKGTEVCQHLSKCAPILDRFNIVRSVHHEVIDEHAAATNRMHTGRPTTGTITYPSVGSVVAHQRGAASEHAPAYVLIGYPNVTRGPGFLGSKAGYVYLTDTHAGPSGFTRSSRVNQSRQDRRERLLSKVRAEYRQKSFGGQTIQDYDESVAEALRLSGPEFMKVFQLDNEKSELRTGYGGEFGQRCLLSRRLIQSGVRFIEVSHNLNFVNGTGWDTHNDGQLNQHLLIKELDSALSALVLDLEQNKLLDKTLIVVASEFGRPAKFDSGGGRGHQSKAFSVVLAGGGLQNGKTIGVTDELGQSIVSRPVSVPDLHATIYCALGIDPSEELHSGDRPVPITDMGQPVRELFG